MGKTVGVVYFLAALCLSGSLWAEKGIGAALGAMGIFLVIALLVLVFGMVEIDCSGGDADG